MLIRASAIGCVLVAAAASNGLAQTIQLPTFSYFTVSTTVSVPDSGGAFLGGVRRSRSGMTSRGVPGFSKVPGISRLFNNRGIGESHSSSGAWATATIIDHSEMDAALLAEAAGRSSTGSALTATDRKALVLSSHVGRSTETGLRLGGDAPRESVAAIRLRNDAAALAHTAEMQGYWQRGQEAESLSRWGAARVSYDVIARRGSGELRQRALTRLAELRAQAQAAAAKKLAASNVAKRSSEDKRSPAAKTGTLVPGTFNRSR